ncbi:MAG: hypothetical protein ABL912_01915 [Novosphingobium sp.]
MPATQYANNASTTLSGAILSTDTTVSVIDGSVFPSPTGTRFFWVTFADGATIEIAKCTSRSGNTLTVSRGEQGTTASGFASGASVELRWTQSDAEGVPDIGRMYAMDRRSFLP